MDMLALTQYSTTGAWHLPYQKCSSLCRVYWLIHTVRYVLHWLFSDALWTTWFYVVLSEMQFILWRCRMVEWLVNGELERIGREAFMAWLEYYSWIFMEAPRSTWRTSVRIACATAEIQTEYFPDTSLKSVTITPVSFVKDYADTPWFMQ
jgi:hypothetical protein